MIRLMLVKTGTEQVVDSIAADDNGILTGTEVIIILIIPWDNYDCVVCEDSYFASVGAAKMLK